MKQQVYMPNGHLIFESEDPRMQYPPEILNQMAAAGYTVKLDGKKLKAKKETVYGHRR